MAGSSIATRAQSMGRFWRSNWVLLRECTLLVLPMVTFSAILLGFIIHYQWHRRNLPVNGLSLDAEFGNSLFYIDYSATRIILIASCSSSTVFALMGSFMTLLSYPLAADMIRNSRVPYLGMLPTPDQLALLIDLLDGKKGALWRWLAGLWKTKGVKTHNVWAVDISAVILVFAIMLSCSIIGTDTWLHVYTKSVPMPYFADVNPAEVGTEYRFSRALAEECWITDQGESERNSTLGKLPCSVRNSDADVKAVHPESINNMLLNNSGSSDTIYRDIASDLSFIGSPSRTTVSLSGDAPPLLPRFNASTFAVRTTCYHYQGCVPPSDPQYNDSFTCDPTFSRGAPRAWFNLSPWNSSQDIRDYETWEDDSWAVYGPYPSFQVDPRNGELIVDSEFGIIEGSLIFVLKCIPSLVEIKYAWANSTMTGLVDEYMANKTLIDILRGPFLSNYSFSDVHLKSFATRLGIGTGAGIYPKEYYTRQYAALLSDIGLSFLGGSIVPRPAINLQVQNETVVTHVPKAALFVLIVFNLWYALLGFCLFLVACYVTAYRGRGADVRAVQQLLTVIGLATAAMDKTRSIPGGNLRIGVEKVEDQWQFKVWDENKDTEGDEHSASAEELLSPNLTGPKGLTSVELTSFGSTLSEEDVQGVVLSEDDIGSRHVQAVGLSDDCSVSRTSSFDRSDLGDHDRRELISQHLLSAERSPHHSEEAPDGSQSPNRDTSSRSSSRAPSRASVDGASDREDVTLMHRE